MLKRKIILLFTAIIGISCSSQDPISSEVDEDRAPASKLTISSTKAGGSCELPGCRPGFSNNAFLPTSTTPPHQPEVTNPEDFALVQISLQGRVVDSQGNPVTNSVVGFPVTGTHLEESGDPFNFPNQSRIESGRFTLAQISPPEETHGITLNHRTSTINGDGINDSFKLISSNIANATLRDAQSKDVSGLVSLQDTGASVRLSGIDEGPYSLEITLIDGNSAIYLIAVTTPTLTDAEGVYTVPNLTAGKWLFQATFVDSAADNLVESLVHTTSLIAPGTTISNVPFELPIIAEQPVLNQALSLDGIDDHANMGNGVPQIVDNLTLEAWVFPESDYGTPELNRIHVISRWGDRGVGNASYSIQLNTSGNLFGTIHNGSLNSESNSSQSVPSLQWSHIAFVREDANARVYINGILSGSVTDPLLPQDSIYDLLIGEEPVGGHNYHGLVDEVRIWNRALTMIEIETNMDQRLTGNEPGLIGYWNFDELSANLVADLSGNNNPGRLVGGAALVESTAPVGP